MTKGTTYVLAPYDPNGDGLTAIVLVQKRHKITTEKVSHLKISTDKDVAYHGETINVKVEPEGSYSPKIIVNKTSDGSFIGDLTLRSGKNCFEDSFTMLDCDITITGKAMSAGDDVKSENPLNVKGKKATIKYKTLKKKSMTLPVEKVITFKNKGKGSKTYALSSAKKGKKSYKKYFKINSKTGKLTVKKGLKKGTYRVMVKVKAAGNANYKASGAKTATFKIIVK